MSIIDQKRQLQLLTVGDQVVVAHQRGGEYLYDLETVTTVDDHHIVTDKDRYLINNYPGLAVNRTRPRYWLSFEGETDRLRSVESYYRWQENEARRDFIRSLRSFAWGSLTGGQIDAIREIIKQNGNSVL